MNRNIVGNESTSSFLSPEIIDTEDLSCTPVDKERKKEEGVQASPDVKNVETQISLRRLQPSIRERELIHENQSLKKKLRRRDIKLLNLTSVLKRLKSGKKRKKEEEVQASPDVKNVATQISFTTTPTKYPGMNIIACKSNSEEEIVYRRDIKFTQT
ncbi:uncharacterized protein LOC112468423 [Temnothorax curvispinosus]|uniref:Uncharacterized protein LOC112468423 n=1 Tax=Temnothorax curvispinosus TaxID=300111 RepID=A0A6J1RL06_9HYME|nr:uncharacterized protein LOC112468423 [Temnothorax curvispinosus]